MPVLPHQPINQTKSIPHSALTHRRQAEQKSHAVYASMLIGRALRTADKQVDLVYDAGPTRSKFPSKAYALYKEGGTQPSPLIHTLGHRRPRFPPITAPTVGTISTANIASPLSNPLILDSSLQPPTIISYPNLYLQPWMNMQLACIGTDLGSARTTQSLASAPAS